MCATLALCKKQSDVTLALTHGLHWGTWQPREWLRDVDTYLRLTRFSFLCRDKDDTITCTWTIKRGRSSIFQYLNWLYTCGIKTSKWVDTTRSLACTTWHRDTINDVKRRSVVDTLLVQRAETTYCNLWTTTTWWAREVTYIHTCHASLQQVLYTCWRSLL